MSIAITVIAVWLAVNVAAFAIRWRATAPVRRDNVHQFKRVRAWR